MNFNFFFFNKFFDITHTIDTVIIINLNSNYKDYIININNIF